MIDAILSGLVLGGIYSLGALGFNLQYGIARVLNLAYGEFLVTSAFAAFWLYTTWGIDPLLGLVLAAPLTFVANWAIYRVLIVPLSRRAGSRDHFESETILATFGLLFIVKGILILLASGEVRAYEYLTRPVDVFGTVFALNRLLAFCISCVLAGAIYVVLTRTRSGTAMRALAVDPVAASIVGVDVTRSSALAFATGGALVAVAGTLISTFIPLDPTVGVEFTMRALIVVIMGGVGNLLGSLAAGFLLGISESLTAHYIDSGLKLAVAYLLFIAVLLIRPRGLFGSN